MITLDQAWKQYLDNARASYKVSLAVVPDGRADTSVRQMLAGQLALCEATAALVTNPYIETQLIFGEKIRICFSRPQWGSLPALVHDTDRMFGIRDSEDSEYSEDSELVVDVVAAFGWLARSTLFLAAGMVDKANESGTNTLDAITRVVIRTGHLRSDLMILMRELGLVHV